MPVELTPDTVAFPNNWTGTRPAEFPCTKVGSGAADRQNTLDRASSPNEAHDFLTVPITAGAAE